MPTGTSFTPWAGPVHLAVLGYARFPEREVGNGFLFVFVITHSIALAHFVEIQIDQLSILAPATLIFLNRKIDRLIRSLIGDPAIHESAYEVDHLRDVISGLWDVMRFYTVEGLEIFKKGVRIFGGEFCNSGGLLTHAPDDLVLHIRNIHHVIDLIASKLQITPDEIGKDKGTEITDMREIMHRWTTTIHTH